VYLSDAERQKLDALLGGDPADLEEVADADAAAASTDGPPEALVDRRSPQAVDIPELRLFVLLRAGVGRRSGDVREIEPR